MELKIFMVCILWIVACTYVVDAFVEYSPTSGMSVTSGVSSFNIDEDDSSLEQTYSLFKVFGNALVFNIEGLPAIFSLFFVLPTVAVGYILLRRLIEFLAAVIPL